LGGTEQEEAEVGTPLGGTEQEEAEVGTPLGGTRAGRGS
jgi:hypothetical protein